MASPSILRDNYVFTGSVELGGSVTLPASSVTNNSVSASAAIAASKLVSRHAVNYVQAPSTDVATETKYLHLAMAGGDIVGINIRPMTAPNGGDKQYTVDLQKAADASGSWSSILSAAVVISSADTSNTAQAGTLATTTYSTDDAFRIVITASGSTGSQGQGLLVTLTLDENPS